MGTGFTSSGHPPSSKSACRRTCLCINTFLSFTFLSGASFWWELSHNLPLSPSFTLSGVTFEIDWVENVMFSTLGLHISFTPCLHGALLLPVPSYSSSFFSSSFSLSPFLFLFSFKSFSPSHHRHHWNSCRLGFLKCFLCPPPLCSPI